MVGGWSYVARFCGTGFSLLAKVNAQRIGRRALPSRGSYQGAPSGHNRFLLTPPFQGLGGPSQRPLPLRPYLVIPSGVR